MNRQTLQLLAEERLKDADTLLAAGQWAGAHYLAGYAVECGLKACIMVRVVNEGLIFTDPKLVEKVWIHRLEPLLKMTGLEAAFGQACQADGLLAVHWTTAMKWEETSRYLFKAEAEARDLTVAVGHPTSGMLQWLRKHW